MIRIFTRQMEKLHSEDGQALVFVAMVGMVIFLFFAMSANLAEIVQTKIKQQNTADAVALSGAVWQARVLNTVSALNQQIIDLWVAQLIVVFMAYVSVLLSGGLPPEMMALILIIDSKISVIFLMQDEVLRAFGTWTLDGDLQNVMELNYDFKPNTADIDVELFMHLHDNNNDLFLINGAGGQPEYVLERGGWCETLAALFYSLCRRGIWPGTKSGNWAGVLGGIYGRAGYVGPAPLANLYRNGGRCFGSWFQTSPLKKTKNLHLYVLHTFDHNNFFPLDPEELLPITDGVYRVPRPPVVHLWGQGRRQDMQCDDQPSKEHWFPCTNEGSFSLSMAHAYSESVSEFYRFLYDPGFPKGIKIRTPYPVPLAPVETDWEARLFPLEPLQDQARVSPHAGAVAFEDITHQVSTRLGYKTGAFLRDNVLMDPDSMDPNEPFFLY